MRIALDGRPLRHPYTGIGVYLQEILSRIAGEHELFVYLDRPLPSPPAFRATLRSGRWSGAAAQAAIHVAYAHWAKRDAAEVFWGPRHHLPLAPSAIPGVVTIHDMTWRLAPETMRPFNRLADATMMPLALARASRVLAVSRHTAALVRRFNPRCRVHVTPLAARLAPSGESCSQPPHPRPYFLFVGQKEPRKNLPGTVEGFRQALERGLEGHDLLLAGVDGWKQQPLRTALEGADVHGRVVDLGPVPTSALARLYRGCEALVLASFYEGFGMPLLEAMRQGRPVVTSGAGGMAEVVGDAAVFVDPQRPATIADAFLRVAGDAGLRRRLADRALMRSRRYSWHSTAGKTLAVLKATAQRAES